MRPNPSRLPTVVFQDANTGRHFSRDRTAHTDRTVVWEDGRSYPLVVVDVTSASHPFWTGADRIVDTEGRVEKFERRYGRRTRRGPREG
ncbi:type B 50S ribosomal protein L31 [Rhodococcus hoagii]|nr:type B 50S ribosomal protein L31 [Prescottella equi]